MNEKNQINILNADESLGDANCTKCLGRGFTESDLRHADGSNRPACATLCSCTERKLMPLVLPNVAEQTWEDQPDQWSEAISKAHPMKTGRHDLRVQAMAMVSSRHSKGALVDLVNWLLLERAIMERALQTIFDHYPHPDISHVDYRVQAARIAEKVLNRE